MLSTMKSLVFVLFATCVFAQEKRDWSTLIPWDVTPEGLGEISHDNAKIVGGEEATPHKFPYQAAIVLHVGNQTGFCGGSVISEKFILTAAHCVQNVSEVVVILGAHKFKENETTQQHYRSSDFITHKNWNPRLLSNDIALIKLPTDIKYTDAIQPVRLPKHSDAKKSLIGIPAVVSGWGRDSDQEAYVSPILRFVETKIISVLRCKIYYLGIPGSKQVCTDGKEGVGSCNGDSGGPLVTYEEDGKPVEQGIVSFGVGFGCEAGWPSVFTRVGSYLDWISSNTGIAIRD